MFPKVTDPCLSSEATVFFLKLSFAWVWTFPSSLNHVLEVYSFDSIALHMDGLNQIPQTHWRVMLNGAEVTLNQRFGEKEKKGSPCSQTVFVCKEQNFKQVNKSVLLVALIVLHCSCEALFFLENLTISTLKMTNCDLFFFFSNADPILRFYWNFSDKLWSAKTNTAEGLKGLYPSLPKGLWLLPNRCLHVFKL